MHEAQLPAILQGLRCKPRLTMAVYCVRQFSRHFQVMKRGRCVRTHQPGSRLALRRLAENQPVLCSIAAGPMLIILRHWTIPSIFHHVHLPPKNCQQVFSRSLQHQLATLKPWPWQDVGSTLAWNPTAIAEPMRPQYVQRGFYR